MPAFEHQILVTDNNNKIEQRGCKAAHRVSIRPDCIAIIIFSSVLRHSFFPWHIQWLQKSSMLSIVYKQMYRAPVFHTKHKCLCYRRIFGNTFPVAKAPYRSCIWMSMDSNAFPCSESATHKDSGRTKNQPCKEY